MPECFLDTNLVEVLLQKPDSVNHQKGNTKIAVLMERKLANNFVVAIIDDDKRALKVLDDFNKVERLCKRGLKLYKHPMRTHYFVQISPAIEQWILSEGKKANINLLDYNLPNHLKGLVGLKDSTQRGDERFGRLFKAMLQNEACDEINELKRWLIFLRDNNFNSNLELL